MRLCGRCLQQLPENGPWYCNSCCWEAPTTNGLLAFAPEMAEEGAGFTASAFAELEESEENSFWFRSRNQLIIWALRRYVPAAKSFFEIGCGTGFVLSGIAAANPNLSLTGSEIFMEGLCFAAQRLPNASLMQMDARHIPFAEEFDAIGAFDVLEHVKEDERVLHEIYRALKPGGGLILTVPQHMFLWSAVDGQACHVRRYAAEELHAKVKGAGFTVLRSTSFVSFLLPLMLIARKRQPRQIGEKKSSELRLPRLVDAALSSIMRCERTCIRAGCNLPVGGSRLLVAVKRETGSKHNSG